MRVTLLGVGEAFDPDEPNAAALVEAAGFTLLIDCGHSAVAPLWRARPDPDAIDAVYLTHHHADHVLGLPPVLDRWAHDGRRKPLLIVTTEAGIDQLRTLFAALRIPAPFGLRYASAARQIGPFAAATAPTRHAAPNAAIRLEAGGRRFAYSGDGRPTPEALALYRDCDLLLHECFEPAPSDNPHHCDLPTVQAIAGPARIGLTHVRAGRRKALREAIAADPRLFLPDAGEILEA